jgi:hypothetical protein
MERLVRYPWSILLAAFVGIVVLAGCGPEFIKTTPLRVERQDQAGTYHVAVLSVAPWVEYVDALQSKFDLEPKEALALAVPTTRKLDDRFLDALRVAIKLSPEQTLRSKNEASHIVHEVKPGDVSAIQTQGSPAGSRTAAGLPPEKSVVDTEAAIDPMLRYWTANALYQEVQLLNRYVKHAAIRNHFIPYVVRLQIGLLPLARNEPYDAFVDVSFFTKAAEEAEEFSRDEFSNPKPVISSLSTQLSQACPTISASPNSGNNFLKLPQVIPLMVSDNVEATAHAQSMNQIQQYSLALLLMAQGFSASGEFDKLRDRLQTVFGHELNSLLTTTRVTDNTVRIRLGAFQHVGSNYAMVPRTHNITLLLMIPCTYVVCNPSQVPSRIVSLMSRATFVDAERGTQLALRPPLVVQNQLEEIKTRFKFAESLVCDGKETKTVDFLEDLVGSVQKSESVEFLETLQSCGASSRYLTSLWADLASVIPGGLFNSTAFDLPQPSRPKLFPVDQTALLLDDLTDKSTVVLQGGKGLETDRLSAVLKVKTAKKEIHLLSQTVTGRSAGKEVSFTFPSLAVWNLKSEAEKPDGVSVTVTYDKESMPCPLAVKMRDEQLYDVRYLGKANKPTPKAPGFSLQSATKAIRADKEGKGTLDLTIAQDKGSAVAKVQVSLIGAEIDKAVQGNTTVGDAPGVEFTAPIGTVRLYLRNLSTHSPVTISAKNAEGTAAESLILSVFQTAK